MSAAADQLDSYGLFTPEAVQDPYPYYRQNARTGASALVGKSASLVLHPLSRRLRTAGPARPQRRPHRDALFVSAANQPGALQRHCRPLQSLAPLPRRCLSRSPQSVISESHDAARRRAVTADDAAARRCHPRCARRPRRFRRLPRLRRTSADAGHARPARPSRFRRGHDAALERSLLELPVSARCPRQAGDGARAARNSRMRSRPISCR